MLSVLYNVLSDILYPDLGGAGGRGSALLAEWIPARQFPILHVIIHSGELVAILSSPRSVHSWSHSLCCCSQGQPGAHIL